MHPDVIAVFASMEVEPVLEEGGFIAGLEIRSVEAESAVRRAGFAPSDRITEINGAPVRDPADLPALLIGLRPDDLTICAERGSEHICRRIAAGR
jgi:S1-C subfamily serine protease